MSIFSLLSMLDQVFEWSRLKIDHQDSPCVDGSETKSSHHEIEDFEILEFAGKRLLVVKLNDHARGIRNLPNQPVPFPCSFGRPIEEVLEILRSKIDRTPRPRK